MQLTKLLREYQKMVLSVGILIASVAGVLLGIVPIVQQTFTMSEQLGGLSAEVDDLKTKVAVLQSIDDVSMRSNAQTLLSAVPSDKSVQTLLGTLDGLAASTGVSTGNFSLIKLGALATESAQRVSADERGIGGNIEPFTINISGTFDQLRGYLASSVSVRRLLRIRTMTISFVKSDVKPSTPTNVVMAALGMDAFYAPLPKTIGSVDQPLTALTSSDEEVISKVTGMKLLAPVNPPPPPSLVPVKTDPFSL